MHLHASITTFNPTTSKPIMLLAPRSRSFAPVGFDLQRQDLLESPENPTIYIIFYVFPYIEDFK